MGKQCVAVIGTGPAGLLAAFAGLLTQNTITSSTISGGAV